VNSRHHRAPVPSTASPLLPRFRSEMDQHPFDRLPSPPRPRFYHPFSPCSPDQSINGTAVSPPPRQYPPRNKTNHSFVLLFPLLIQTNPQFLPLDSTPTFFTHRPPIQNEYDSFSSSPFCVLEKGSPPLLSRTLFELALLYSTISLFSPPRLEMSNN